MPSWAIPKGPTLDPKLKRLAMKVEDHELKYRNFEGVIPEGYGAGTVMIWDEGEYIPEREVSKGVREEIKDPKEQEEVMKQGLEKGEIKFLLKGKKLQGSFALVKTKNFGPKNSWLLIKHQDKFCKLGFEAGSYPRSAKSNKTLEEIAAS